MSGLDWHITRFDGTVIDRAPNERVARRMARHPQETHGKAMTCVLLLIRHEGRVVARYHHGREWPLRELEGEP